MELAQINERIKEKGYQLQITETDIGRFVHGENQEWARVFEVGEDGVRVTLGRWNSGDRVTVFSGALGSQKDQVKAAKEQEKVLTDKNLRAMRISQQIWNESHAKDLIGEPGEYLAKKGLARHPASQLIPSPNSNTRFLLVPMIDEHGELWNLQTIGAPGGDKFYKAEGRTKGLFHPLSGMKSTILLCEGYATGLALHQATGFTTYVAFTVTNLEAVLKVILKNTSPGAVVICADWDGETYLKKGVNPGMLEAVKLGEKYRVKIAAPVISGEKNTDFADIYQTSTGQHDVNHRIKHAHLASTYAPHEFDSTPPKTKKVKKLMDPEPSIPNTDETLKLAEEWREKNPPPFEPVPIGSMVTGPEKSVVPGPEAPLDVSFIINGPMRQQIDYDTISKEIFTDLTQKKFPKPTIKNFKRLMEFVGASFRYNVIRKDQEWFLPGEDKSEDNEKNYLRSRLIDLCVRADLQPKAIDNYIDYLCEENQFNPVMSWIKLKPWDGKDRIQELLETIEVREEKTSETRAKLKSILIRKWLTMAVKAASSPNGLATPGMLVFQGLQSLGKTSWFMSLTPRELELAADSKVLNPNDKDLVKQIVCFWMVELGELEATFKKSDVAALKAFITKSSDMFRAAYARYDSNFHRRTVFFGSVNPEHFLVDPTGNRRFWTLPVVRINYQHSIDTQQLWAQVYEGLKKGDTWYLTHEEEALLNKSNQAFEQIEPIEEMLAARFNWSVHGSDMSATQLAEKIGIFKCTNAEAQKVAHFAKKLSGQVSRPSHGRKLLWVGVEI